MFDKSSALSVSSHKAAHPPPPPGHLQGPGPGSCSCTLATALSAPRASPPRSGSGSTLTVDPRLMTSRSMRTMDPRRMPAPHSGSMGAVSYSLLYGYTVASRAHAQLPAQVIGLYGCTAACRVHAQLLAQVIMQHPVQGLHCTLLLPLCPCPRFCTAPCLHIDPCLVRVPDPVLWPDTISIVMMGSSPVFL